MKIIKLILKNFSAVKNSMNATELIIDFSNAVNKVCLLIGPNGSGKTTILSQLHPFADVGNLDVRNGNNLILPDKDGYKEIQIVKGDDTFIIKHFYTPQKDKNHSVKSYIIKNDVDLNVNGNVTSFKEIVKEELQIEPEYLKLIRLGANVTSMIDLTATERKNFMSKIMDEIGIYLEFYKIINQKLRQIDELKSHTVDKILRLEITDEKTEEKNIEKVRNSLSLIEDENIRVSSELLKIREFIESFGNLSEYHSNGIKITNKYTKMSGILSKKDSLESFEPSFYEKKINDALLTINSLENERTTNEILIKNSLSYLDTLHNQLQSYNVQLSKEANTDREMHIMNENLNKMRLKLREFEGNLKDFSPNYTKEEFDTFYRFLVNIQKILFRTYEFGKKPIEKVIELMENDKNVINYINKHLISLDESRSDKTSLFMATLMTRFLIGKDEPVMIQCEKDCQAKQLFNQIQNLLIDSDVDDKLDDSNLYHDMEFVYNNIKTVLTQFSEYQTIIDNLPSDISKDFILTNIYNKIKKMESIYDEKKMNEISSLLYEYESYLTLLAQYEEQERTYNSFSSLSSLDSVKEQIKTTEECISEEKNKVIGYKNRITEIGAELREANQELEVLVDIKETLEEFDSIKEKYLDYISNKEKLLSADTKQNELISRKVEITTDKNNLNEELQKLITNLEKFREYTKDNNKFSKIYDELNIIKSALSSKSGIPLRIISNYLNNTNDITNEFLHMVYDGKIYIDNFNITATEFGIPFFNNGVRLEDVKYASQGELSFLSIALSFALSSQVLSRYNIMLLDEIDGPLDISNREKFIKILEAQIDKTGSEQSFLITHNAMFSSYPVDIIDLSFKKKSDVYELANYIDIIRK